MRRDCLLLRAVVWIGGAPRGVASDPPVVPASCGAHRCRHDSPSAARTNPQGRAPQTFGPYLGAHLAVVIEKDDIEYVVSPIGGRFVRAIESERSIRGRWPWGTASDLVRMRGFARRVSCPMCTKQTHLPMSAAVFRRWRRRSLHRSRSQVQEKKRSTADWYPVESALVGSKECAVLLKRAADRFTLIGVCRVPNVDAFFKKIRICPN